MKRSELPEAARLCAQYLDPARPVLAAVSGGLDSMCLLHFLRAEGYNVSCAHFNHRLRGEESDRDEYFVRAWCAENGIPFFAGSGDVRAHARTHGQSIEEAARTLRHAFLRKTAEQLDAQITLAHHMDDNAETVLLNLIRGTDLRGLSGMRPAQDGLLRPLLPLTRAELAAYAERNGVPHVEDRTNADPDAAARNYLRLVILPRLQTLNPRACEHITAAARSLAALDDAVEQEASALMTLASVQSGSVSLPRGAFLTASRAAQARTVLHMADALGLGRRDIGRKQLNAVLALAQKSGRAERSVSLPRGARVLCAGGALTMLLPPAAPEPAVLLPHVPLRFGAFTLTLLDAPDGAGFCLRALRPEETLTAAPCSAGAYLTLAGATGARSVKRLCIDRHIPPSARDTLPALYVNGQLAAVWPLGADTAFSPAPDSGQCFVRVSSAQNFHVIRGESSS